MSITMYGIANCDTIKKAKTWLSDNNIEFTFHDYRKQGLDQNQLEQWVDELGWETLLNRRGTTWRKLEDSIKDNIDHDSAISVMINNPAIIKRPLLDNNGQLTCGFKADQYQTLLK